MNDVERILENLRGGSYGQIDLNKHDLDSAIRKVKELMEVDPVRKEQQENDLRKILSDLGAIEKSDQLRISQMRDTLREKSKLPTPLLMKISRPNS